MGGKRMTINLVANIISFAVGLMTSFFLSPYIVRVLGKEAYGFIPMMNNILSMSQIITIAVNSMGARFITIAYHRKDYESANKYFSSLFYANLIMGMAIIVLSAIMIFFIEGYLDVPPYLVKDVRISFSLMAVAFSIGLIFNVFSTATYVQNRLDMSAKREIVYQLLRGAILLTLFSLFKPTIIYMAVASLTISIYTVVVNYRYTRMLLPDFHIKRKYLSFSALGELISSGIWNSVGRLSHTLMTGLDLIIANMFISAAAMGTLSISQTIPTSINSLVNTVVAVFLPTVTIKYAKGTSEDVVKELMRAIKMVGVVIAPVLSFFIGYGRDFYALWQPTENAAELHMLSVLAILPLYFTLGMKSTGNIFSITNKLKLYTMAVLACGVTTVAVVFVLLKFTNLGIIAIAMVSSLCLIVKDLTFTPLYAAKCIKVSPLIFYSQIVKEFFIVVLSVAVSLVFNHFLPGKTWGTLILWGGVSVLAVFVLQIALSFGKQDYIAITDKIKGIKERG